MHKMWKKVMAVVCALTLIMGMSVVAGAAESPTGSGSASGGEIEDQDGKVDGVEAITKDLMVLPVGYFGEKYAENENLIKSETGIKEILGKQYKEGTALTLLAHVDLYLLHEDGGQISVRVDGVKKGDTIYVLHYNEKNYDSATQIASGDWEVITPDEVGDGTVTFTCESFSPFAFVKATKVSTGGEGGKVVDSGNKTTGSGNKTTDTGVKKSPKTGEF